MPSYSLSAMRLAIIIVVHLSTPAAVACALAGDRQGRGTGCKQHLYKTVELVANK